MKHLKILMCRVKDGSEGCGICASECPAKAIQLMHYKDEQVMAKVEAMFEVRSYTQNQVYKNCAYNLLQSFNNLPQRTQRSQRREELRIKKFFHF